MLGKADSKKDKENDNQRNDGKRQNSLSKSFDNPYYVISKESEIDDCKKSNQPPFTKSKVVSKLEGSFSSHNFRLKTVESSVQEKGEGTQANFNIPRQINRVSSNFCAKSLAQDNNKYMLAKCNSQKLQQTISNRNDKNRVFNRYFDKQTLGVEYDLDYIAMIEAKTEEILSLEKTLEKLEASNEFIQKKLSKKKADYDRLRVENEMLKRRLDDCETSKEIKLHEVSKIKTILTNKEEGLLEIESLVKATEGRFHEIEERNAMLENTNSQLTKKLNMIKEAQIKLKEKYDQGELKDRESQLLIERLRKELLTHKKRIEKLEEDISNLQALDKDQKSYYFIENAKTMNLLEQQKRDIESLKSQINEKDFLIHAYEEKKSIADNELKLINEKLYKEKEKSKSLSEEIQNIVVEYEAQVREKDRIINSNVQTYESQERQVYEKIIILEKESIMNKEENSRLNRQLENTNEKLREMQTKIEDKDHKLSKLRFEIEELNNELKIKQEHLDQERNSEEKESRKRTFDLSSQLDEARLLYKENLDLKKKIDVMHDQSNRLLYEKGQIKAHLENKQDKEIQLTQEIDRLQNQINDMNMQIKTAQSQMYANLNNAKKEKQNYKSKIQKVILIFIIQVKT